jgi:hypothetical protein
MARKIKKDIRIGDWVKDWRNQDLGIGLVEEVWPEVEGYEVPPMVLVWFSDAKWDFKVKGYARRESRVMVPLMRVRFIARGISLQEDL